MLIVPVVEFEIVIAAAINIGPLLPLSVIVPPASDGSKVIGWPVVCACATASRRDSRASLELVSSAGVLTTSGEVVAGASVRSGRISRRTADPLSRQRGSSCSTFTAPQRTVHRRGEQLFAGHFSPGGVASWPGTNHWRRRARRGGGSWPRLRRGFLPRRRRGACSGPMNALASGWSATG